MKFNLYPILKFLCFCALCLVFISSDPRIKGGEWGGGGGESIKIGTICQNHFRFHDTSRWVFDRPNHPLTSATILYSIQLLHKCILYSTILLQQYSTILKNRTVLLHIQCYYSTVLQYTVLSTVLLQQFKKNRPFPFISIDSDYPLPFAYKNRAIRF